MNLSLQADLATGYRSGLQVARILTEHWVGGEAYCTNCGYHPLQQFANNNRTGDFHCPSCLERYELKSQRTRFGAKVIDGAYQTMLDRLASANNPNLFLLNYDVGAWRVSNFIVIPKHFVTPSIIEKKNPLPPSARRAGWIGCRILLDAIPQSGHIFLVENHSVRQKQEVLEEWRKTLFLRDQKNFSAKGWLLNVMRCIDRIGRPTFSLADVYAFEAELRDAYPGNKNIRAKIRQKLQALRDNGYLIFLGNGMYRLAG